MGGGGGVFDIPPQLLNSNDNLNLVLKRFGDSPLVVEYRGRVCGKAMSLLTWYFRVQFQKVHKQFLAVSFVTR